MKKLFRPCPGTPSGRHRWRIVDSPHPDETHACTKCPARGVADSSDIVRVVDVENLSV